MRVSSSCEAKTVGKIRVLSYVGGTYLRGEVTEGVITEMTSRKKETFHAS